MMLSSTERKVSNHFLSRDQDQVTFIFLTPGGAFETEKKGFKLSYNGNVRNPRQLCLDDRSSRADMKSKRLQLWFSKIQVVVGKDFFLSPPAVNH